MGIEERQIETIIEAHTDTVNGLKAKRDEYKELAAQVPDLQKQLEEVAAALEESEDWKSKYEGEKKALKDYQAKVEDEKAERAKAKAYRDMLEEAGIDPKRINAVMRVTDLTKVEMSDGKLKDADKLAESAKSEWSDFVLKTKTQGANPATPPRKSNEADGADPEVEKRMAERHERMFGTTNSKE